MIKLTLLFCLVLSASVIAQTNLPAQDVAKISSAIYQLEGGRATKYPYGVRSIKTHGDVEKAKQICENTIRNNFRRWQKTDKSLDFLTFLANVYCPKSADAIGNKNWIKNIHKLVDK